MYLNQARTRESFSSGPTASFSAFIKQVDLIRRLKIRKPLAGKPANIEFAFPL
jgi:hypothetical protein